MSVFLIAVLTLGAGFIGTVTGFGTSTIMVAVLVSFIPFAEALFLVGVIHVTEDIWRIVLFRKGIQWPLVLRLMVPGVLGAVAGSVLVPILSEAALIRILGIILVLYSLFVLLRPKVRMPMNAVNITVGGGLYGLVAGIAGSGGAVRAAVLEAFGLDSLVYLATNALLAIAIDVIRVSVYAAEGFRIRTEFLLWLPVFIALAYASAFLGRMAVRRISQDHFRMGIAVVLVLAGIKFLVAP